MQRSVWHLNWFIYKKGNAILSSKMFLNAHARPRGDACLYVLWKRSVVQLEVYNLQGSMRMQLSSVQQCKWKPRSSFDFRKKNGSVDLCKGCFHINVCFRHFLWSQILKSTLWGWIQTRGGGDHGFCTWKYDNTLLKFHNIWFCILHKPLLCSY